jgi:uncharacterized iron-regulated membrane protein
LAAIEEQLSPNPQISFFAHPQRVWLRIALFQIHLWTGLTLGFYVCVMGLSGSAIVLEDELTRLTRPDLFRRHSHEIQPWGLLPETIKRVERTYPQFQFTEVFFPTRSSPVIQFEGTGKDAKAGGSVANVYVDPSTGQILGSTDRTFWISWIRGLHVRLLAGRTGLILNGCGAILLLMLAATGSVLWWPGVRNWKRAFKVDLRRRWTRINFDLHSAIGLWLLFFVSTWSLSGIYFVWPRQFVAVLDSVTPTKSAVYPTVRVTPRSQPAVEIGELIEKALSLKPGAHVLEIELPQQSDDPAVVVVAYEDNFRLATYFFFDPFTGENLRIWERAKRPSLGSSILPWMIDLHFGQGWGLTFKLIWALLGLSLPVMAVTGALMYWNRFLCKKWRKTQRSRVRSAQAKAALEEQVG